jgi:hypothetical protein
MSGSINPVPSVKSNTLVSNDRKKLTTAFLGAYNAISKVSPAQAYAFYKDYFLYLASQNEKDSAFYRAYKSLEKTSPDQADILFKNYISRLKLENSQSTFR